MRMENGKVGTPTADRATRLLFIALAALSTLHFQFSVAQAPAQPRDSLIVYYTDGVRLMAEERYDEAAGVLERALSLDPDHAPSLFHLAGALTATGEAERALPFGTRAVELDPDNSWYRNSLGRLLAGLGRYDEAVELFEGGVSAGGKFDPDNYQMLAILYYRQGRTDNALATLDSAAVRMGVTPGIVEMKRGILIEAGRIDEALAVTESYVAASPYDEDNRLALAQIYAYQRRDSLQAETLKQVVEINPDNAEALDSLAELYRSRGQSALYMATLRQLFTLPGVPLETKIDRFETMARNTSFYRNHYFEMGQLALTLMGGYPGEASVVELYADHAARGGETEAALTTIKNRLARPVPTPGLYMKAIEIEAWMGRSDSVAVWSDRALEHFPGEINIYLLRSSALQYMGRAREAQKTLSRALRVATTDSGLREGPSVQPRQRSGAKQLRILSGAGGPRSRPREGHGGQGGEFVGE